MEDSGFTVGSEMNEGRSKAIKGFLLFASVIVYLAGIMYAEVHGFSLLSKGINPDLMMWAIIGIFALGITAIALPAGLHFWFHAPQQKIFAYGFYMVDLTLLFFNAVADNAWIRGSDMPFWLSLYMVYIVPATPVICALGWSILWILDPSSKERSMIESLRASTRETLARKIAAAANDASVTDQVERAAQAMAASVIAQTLGVSMKSASVVAKANGNGNGSKTNGHGKKQWELHRPDSDEGDEDIEIVYDTKTKTASVNTPKA